MLLELTPSQSQEEEEIGVHHRPKIEDTVSASSRVLLFLESEERSSRWFVLLLGAWGQCLTPGSCLLLRVGLAVDPCNPQVHLILIRRLEEVVSAVCKSKNILEMK